MARLLDGYQLLKVPSKKVLPVSGPSTRIKMIWPLCCPSINLPALLW